MNNYINYYYELYPEQLYEEGNNYKFVFNGEKYYLLKYDRELNDIKTLSFLNKEMINRGSLVHEIIPTIEKEILINIYGVYYSLVRVYINDEKKITINDIIFMSKQNQGIKSNDILNHMHWGMLWEMKIDYFEYQIGHLLKKYPFLYKNIDYYIGLGENAISYFKNIDGNIANNKPQITIAHKRIGINSTLFDLYNPFNLIIDYNIRDVAEYIKDAFFNSENANKLIQNIKKNYYFDQNTINLLFSRLLFPSYYFDLYEYIIENGLKESKIQRILKKSIEYELFLKEVMRSFPIIQIEWINQIHNT